jgi:RNA polymerase sigma-70 factor (ECF subfamily)
MTPDTADHADLLARVALQDRRALRDLYDATAARLFAIALRMLRDRAAAEDVIQDAFLTIWSRAPQFPTLHTHPLAWMTTIVRNRAIDSLRRRRDDDEAGDGCVDDAPDDAPGPFERLHARDVKERLADCMQRLAAEPRLAIVLAYDEGLTHDALAKRLGRPLGTVKAWVRRSLLQLRDCLGATA